MNRDEQQKLINMAIEARELAYCPYSGFSVGAALLTGSGKMYKGCNIESASYSPSNCAERTAFFNAISNGETKFKAIAVAGGKKGEETNGKFPPCGVCRQVMMEFCNPSTFKILMAKTKDEWEIIKLKDLLPEGFGPNNLK